MLGKTNITVLSEGSIVTEVEDFKWVQMQSGTYNNFIKAIYKNGCLAAIAENGTVAYTTDGEVWHISAPEYEDCKLNDIEWDGSRFLLVGSHTATIEGLRGTFGLILATENFTDFTSIYIKRDEDSYTGSNREYDIEYYAIYAKSGEYTVLAKRQGDIYLHVYGGDLVGLWRTHDTGLILGFFPETISVAKNSSGMLMCCNAYFHSSSSTYNARYNAAYKIYGDSIKTIETISTRSSSDSAPMVYAVECKDALYYASSLSSDDYKFGKVSDSNEVFLMSAKKNYAFKSGVYFNRCQLFINSHEMLIIKDGESIADKAVEDMIEIAPELTMNFITKAFGQLYIFGNQGIILKSSMESGNEEAIAVQTLSAKKALEDAKAYTDARYAELADRITALETQPGGTA